jgi:hypothetical protein
MAAPGGGTMTSTTFIIGDDAGESIGSAPLQVKVTITEVGGDLQVTLEVVSGFIADLRGFFFNLADDTLIDTLSVTGSDITDSAFDTDEDGVPEIDNVPPGEPTINPGGPFFVGIELGTTGTGSDDISTTSFTIHSSTTALTLADIADQDVGVRATSVGADREGSSKVVGTVPSTFSISGTKYQDMDGDGQVEDGDTGLGGFTIFVDDDADGTYDVGERTALTAADGSWKIDGLTDADIGKKVYEVNQVGYAQTLGEDGIEITERDQSNINFANFDKFDITGNKFEDKDGDGVRDPNEGAPSTIFKIALCLVSTTTDESFIVRTAFTNASGDYSFEDVGPPPAGWTYAVKEIGYFDGNGALVFFEDLGDASDWIQTYGASAYPVGATSGLDVTDLDFGNFKKFDLSGTKYLDANGDGKTDGDTGLGGVTIYVDMDGSGTLTAGDLTTVTAADGSWSFNDLGTGFIGKKVYEDSPDGYVQTLGVDGYTINGTSGSDQTGLNFANALEQCFDGLSQGYWSTHIGGRNKPANAWDDGYSQGDTYDSIFGVNAFSAAFGDKTLLQAITTNGGGEAALARQAVAALLNSVSANDGLTADYRFTADEIIAAVKLVYDGGFDAVMARDLQNVLEFWNIVPEKQADGELCGVGSTSTSLIYDKDGDPLTTGDILNGGSFNGGLLEVLAALNPDHGWA